MGYKTECSVTIGASREVVWSAVLDFSRRAEWDARVVGAEMLTPPPQGRGMHFLLTYRVLGIRSWVESECIVWHPPQRTAIRAVAFSRGNLVKTASGSWHFHENADGSTTWTTKVDLGVHGGPVAPLLERLVGWYFKRLTERGLLNARRLIEEAQTANEKRKGFNPRAAWDTNAVAEAEQAAAKSNAARGDDTDHLLKVTGMMIAGPNPRYTED